MRDIAAETIAELRQDADRYRWLRAQKRLRLQSDGGMWTRDGETFHASHNLAANDTQYGPYATLDETIDFARGFKP